jgi:5'-deoxynucleotidase
MRSNQKENILEHSLQAAQIAHALALINNKLFGGKLDAGFIACAAMYHEASEVITGDLPSPIKYYNPAIKEAYKNIEQIANDKLLSMLPDALKGEYEKLIKVDPSSIEYKYIKAADKLCAYIKCIEELKTGNLEFHKAGAAIKADLEKIDLPEVAYFMHNFIAAYEKTLDELD